MSAGHAKRDRLFYLMKICQSGKFHRLPRFVAAAYASHGFTGIIHKQITKGKVYEHQIV
jgi:hypothetical protein